MSATFARRFRRADGRAAATIRELLDAPGAGDRFGEGDREGNRVGETDREDNRAGESAAQRLDPLGVRAAWHGEESPRTCFRGIERVPCAADPAPSAAPLDEALLAATARAFRSSGGGGAALALSGGLDSALILAWARELGLAPPVYVLAADLGAPDYDERAAACALARRFGVEPIVIEAREDDFVAALPTCVRAVETALYNPHPVARYLLARRAAADGVEVLVTGDGADQIFAGVSGADYLPLVGALSAACGVLPQSPFLDEAVIACARAAPPDADKSRLRAIARRWLPESIARAPKLARLTPPLDLSRHWDRARAERLAAQLGAPLALDGDRARVRWTTLLLLCEQFAIGLD